MNVKERPVQQVPRQRIFGRLVGTVGKGPRQWDYRPGGCAYSRSELARALLWLRRLARTDLL